jgi:hypothetical protein
MILHVTDARYIRDYQVELKFNDGKGGVADLRDSLNGPMFEPLQDVNEFAKLKMDHEMQTIVWPNGADLAPEYLYFLAFKNDPTLQDQFKAWEYIS